MYEHPFYSTLNLTQINDGRLMKPRFAVSSKSKISRQIFVEILSQQTI